MATKYASAKVLNEKNKFEKMREDLDKKFSELTSLVNQKKLDLDRKIDDLELEYNKNNKQIEKDRETLIRLREHNAQELSQNSLIELQENFNEDIAQKIQELTNELDGQLTSELTLDFDLDALKDEIDRIDVQLDLLSEDSYESSSDDYSTPSPKPKSMNRIVVQPKKKPVLQRDYSPEIPINVTSKKAKYDPGAKKSHARLK